MENLIVKKNPQGYPWFGVDVSFCMSFFVEQLHPSIQRMRFERALRRVSPERLAATIAVQPEPYFEPLVCLAGVWEGSSFYRRLIDVINATGICTWGGPAEECLMTQTCKCYFTKYVFCKGMPVVYTDNAWVWIGSQHNYHAMRYVIAQCPSVAEREYRHQKHFIVEHVSKLLHIRILCSWGWPEGEEE
jgi:hypothetical protein